MGGADQIAAMLPVISMFDNDTADYDVPRIGGRSRTLKSDAMRP